MLMLIGTADIVFVPLLSKAIIVINAVVCVQQWPNISAITARRFVIFAFQSDALIKFKDMPPFMERETAVFRKREMRGFRR